MYLKLKIMSYKLKNCTYWFRSGTKTGESQRCGFVRFERESDGLSAIAALNSKKLKGENSRLRVTVYLLLDTRWQVVKVPLETMLISSQKLKINMKRTFFEKKIKFSTFCWIWAFCIKKSQKKRVWKLPGYEHFSRYGKKNRFCKKNL